MNVNIILVKQIFVKLILAANRKTVVMSAVNPTVRRHSRELLYHRGIDDQVGTYVTDYVESGVCFFLATYLLVLNRRQNIYEKSYSVKNIDGNVVQPSKCTIAVVVVQYSISISALLGGLTHHFLQKVSVLKVILKLID